MKSSISLVFIACIAAVLASYEKSKRDALTSLGVDQCEKDNKATFKKETRGVTLRRMCEIEALCEHITASNKKLWEAANKEGFEIANDIKEIMEKQTCKDTLESFVVEECEDNVADQCLNNATKKCNLIGASDMWKTCEKCGYCTINYNETCGAANDKSRCAGDLICDSNKCICDSSKLHNGSNVCIDPKNYGELCEYVRCVESLVCDKNNNNCTCDNSTKIHTGDNVCVELAPYSEKIFDVYTEEEIVGLLDVGFNPKQIETLARARNTYKDIMDMINKEELDLGTIVETAEESLNTTPCPNPPCLSG